MTADDLKLVQFAAGRIGGVKAAMILLVLDRGGAGAGELRDCIRRAIEDPTYNLPGEGEPE